MRFRFTIRDLLWLAALVAICVAWWIDRNRVAADYEEAIRKTDRFYERERKSDAAGVELIQITNELLERKLKDAQEAVKPTTSEPPASR